MKNWFLYLLCFFVLIISIIIYIKQTSRSQIIIVKSKKDTSNLHLNVYADSEYLGIQQCKQCHYDIYKTFIETGMGQSFNHAKKEYSSAKFDTILNDKELDITYKPYWNNDSLFISEYHHKFNFSDTSHIDYIVVTCDCMVSDQ